MTNTNAPDPVLLADEMELADSTKAKAANAEQEMLLQYLLGIDMRPETNGNDIARRVTTEVLGAIDATRTNIQRAGLERTLEINIGNALRNVRPSRNRQQNLQNNLELRRVHAVAEAIWASLPKAAVDDLLRYRMPVALQIPKVDATGNVDAIDAGLINGLQRHELLLRDIMCKDGSARNFVIDTRHTFWVENGPFDTPDLLRDAIKNQKLESVGIRAVPPTLPPSYALDETTDATNIANYANLNIVSLTNRYAQAQGQVNLFRGDHFENVPFTINTDRFVATPVPAGSAAPAVQKRLMGNLNEREITDILLNRNAFHQLIPGFNNGFGVSDNPNDTMEDPANPGTQITIAAFITRQIFVAVTGAVPVPNTPLCAGTMRLNDIQKELREQHQYHRRLRNGTDNAMGAAFAASILMRYKDVGDVLGGGDATKIRTERTNASRDQGIVINLEKIEGITTPISEDTAADVDYKIAQIAPYLSSLPASYQLGAGRGRPEPPVTIGAGKGNQDSARGQLGKRQAELQAEKKKYAEAADMLTQLHIDIVARGSSVPAALKAITGNNPAPDPLVTVLANLNGKDLRALVAETRNLITLKKKDEYDADLKKLDQQLRDINDGKIAGLSGLEAQHAVISKYFEKYQNCSPEEAAKAASYILGRSAVDADLTALQQRITNELYQDDRTYGERMWDWTKNSVENTTLTPGRHANNITCEIARAAGISVPFARFGTPDWEGATDGRQLSTAYFALKELYDEGTKGNYPKHMQLPMTRYVQTQMNRISAIMLKKFSAQLLEDIGPENAVDDEKKKAILGAANKKEMTRQLEKSLSGKTPEFYQERVKSCISRASRRVEWKRRTLKWGAAGTAKAGAKATAWTAKKGAAATVWTATKGFNVTKAVAYDAPKAVLVDAPVAVTKTAWKNKGSIAAIGAASLIGGPVLGLGAWYLAKQFGGSKSSSGGGHH